MSVTHPIICTIITRNRLAWARTLADSFNEFHPGGECYVLIIDDTEGSIHEGREPFRAIHLADLELPDQKQMLFKYGPLELCCALKPYVLKYLMDGLQEDRFFYFDSDIMFCAPMDQILSDLDTADVLLTPHLEQDLPLDGKMPNDGFIMLSGVFNAGFIGVKASPEGARFLDWWRGKLSDGCIVDHFNGYFVDQKYLDLVPGLFASTGLLSDAGCNVGYWNLHSRTISRDQRGWKSNERPLVFYHFSGYRLAAPEEISGHQSRFKLENIPELKDLFGLYASRLIEHGDEECRHLDYGFSRYRNGKKIRVGARRAFLLKPQLRTADPFDSRTHSFRFRIEALRQSLAHQVTRGLHRFIRNM